MGKPIGVKESHRRQGAGASRVLDIDHVRADFPILKVTPYDRPLVYLDNAATTQKPQRVIDRLVRYYTEENANIHRGVHFLSGRATVAYEAVRDRAQHFIGANAREEIVFVRGTTEAVNLVAQSYARPRLSPGDEILVTGMEHHSNIVPWQMVCEATGAKLQHVPLNDAGEAPLQEFERRLGPRTRFVAVVYVSNALGSVNPVREMVTLARDKGIPTLVDGAQAAAHMPVDVSALGADFYAFSSHKLYGPTGVGVLYGRRELLEEMVPYQGGGEMISSVSFEETSYAQVPHKFEAGTPNIAGVIGLGAAIEYVSEIGLDVIGRHEADLLEYATARMSSVEGLRIFGTAANKASIVSFTVEDIHPHDMGTILDREGIAIRTGHHCAQPVMERFGVPATARASLAMYNSREEIDALVDGLGQVKGLFR